MRDYEVRLLCGSRRVDQENFGFYPSFQPARPRRQHLPFLIRGNSGALELMLECCASGYIAQCRRESLSEMPHAHSHLLDRPLHPSDVARVPVGRLAAFLASVRSGVQQSQESRAATTCCATLQA